MALSRSWKRLPYKDREISVTALRIITIKIHLGDICTSSTLRLKGNLHYQYSPKHLLPTSQKGTLITQLEKELTEYTRTIAEDSYFSQLPKNRRDLEALFASLITHIPCVDIYNEELHMQSHINHPVSLRL